MITVKIFNEIKSLERDLNIRCYSIVERKIDFFNLKFKTEDNLFIAINDFQIGKQSLFEEFVSSLHKSKNLHGDER